jgi:hypothetical protein
MEEKRGRRRTRGYDHWIRNEPTKDGVPRFRLNHAQLRIWIMTKRFGAFISSSSPFALQKVEKLNYHEMTRWWYQVAEQD